MDFVARPARIVNVASIAALRALGAPASNGADVIVEGYYATADGGGGTFTWNNTDATADNGGTVIIPNSAPGTGRWNLLHNGTLNVRQFGAKGDDTNDDTAAINAASAVTPANGGLVVLGPGTFKITGPIKTKRYNRFQGAGYTASTVHATHDGIAFDLGQPSAGFDGTDNTLSDFSIYGNRAATASSVGVHLGQGLTFVPNVHFERMLITQFDTGVLAESTFLVDFDACYITYCDVGVNLNPPAASFLTTFSFRKCSINNCLRQALVNNSTIGAQSIVFLDTNVEQCGDATYSQIVVGNCNSFIYIGGYVESQAVDASKPTAFDVTNGTQVCIRTYISGAKYAVQTAGAVSGLDIHGTYAAGIKAGNPAISITGGASSTGISILGCTLGAAITLTASDWLVDKTSVSGGMSINGSTPAAAYQFARIQGGSAPVQLMGGVSSKGMTQMHHYRITGWVVGSIAAQSTNSLIDQTCDSGFACDKAAIMATIETTGVNQNLIIKGRTSASGVGFFHLDIINPTAGAINPGTIAVRVTIIQHNS